jgi:hypothetical protein
MLFRSWVRFFFLDRLATCWHLNVRKSFEPEETSWVAFCKGLPDLDGGKFDSLRQCGIICGWMPLSLLQQITAQDGEFKLIPVPITNQPLQGSAIPRPKIQ